LALAGRKLMCPSLVAAAGMACLGGGLWAVAEEEQSGGGGGAREASVITRTEARTLTLSIPGPRGLITDREGQPLAQNRVGHYFALQFAHLEDPGTEEILSWARKRIGHAQSLAGETWPVEDEELLAHYEDRRWLPFTFSSIVDPEKTEEYGAKLMEGLVLHPVYLRHYPEGELAAHVIGYVRSKGKLPTGPINAGDPLFEDSYGDAGLEKFFDDELSGTAGERRVIYDSKGNKRLDRQARRPRVGHTVVTTLNLEWQKHAESVLAKSCRRGALVVIDIPTGEVLVLASRPSYDINRWVPRISEEEYEKLRDDPSKIMFARAYQGQYPPASAFKPVVALTALTNNTVQEWTKIECPVKIKIGDKWFHNHSKYPDGAISVKRAIARSNNCWFYQVGIQTGPRSFLSLAKRLGFGSKTGLPLHGESPGRVPTEQYVRKTLGRGYTDGDTANYAIGQAWEATPLQVAQAMAGIANGTVLPRLRLIRQVQDAKGRVLSAPGPEARNPLMLDPDAVDVVHEGMHEVVHGSGGTGQRGALSFTGIAAKTGTGQWIPAEDRKVAWYAGFLPYENPRLAFAVLYEGDSGEDVSGGRKAAPMVPKFFEPLKDELELMIKPPSKALIVSEGGGTGDGETEEGAEGPAGGVLAALPVERIEGDTGSAVAFPVEPEEPEELGGMPMPPISVENAPAAIPVEEEGDETAEEGEE